MSLSYNYPRILVDHEVPQHIASMDRPYSHLPPIIHDNRNPLRTDESLNGPTQDSPTMFEDPWNGTNATLDSPPKSNKSIIG